MPSSFGLFHVNIASLDKHIDDLKLILSLLNYNFDIIGISEHKILKDTLPSNNIKIPGYEEFIFEPTETTHGGTGFYIKVISITSQGMTYKLILLQIMSLCSLKLNFLKERI